MTGPPPSPTRSDWARRWPGISRRRTSACSSIQRVIRSACTSTSTTSQRQGGLAILGYRPRARGEKRSRGAGLHLLRERIPDDRPLAVNREIALVPDRLPRSQEVAADANQVRQDRGVVQRDKPGSAHPAMFAGAEPPAAWPGRRPPNLPGWIVLWAHHIQPPMRAQRGFPN